MTTYPTRKVIAGAMVPLAFAAVGLAIPWMLKRSLQPAMRDIACTPGDLGLAGTQVWLSGTGDKSLHGWWIPVRGTAPSVVVMHGWGANASLLLPFARPLHNAGFHVFFLDARGHGLSEADDYASMPRFAEDLDVALDWVHGREAVTDVGVIGHSLGAGAAALAVERRDDVAALVSVSGPADVWEVMARNTLLGRMPEAARRTLRRTMERIVGTTFAEVAPARTMSTIVVPTMVVHGEDDEIVPLEHAFRLVEACPGAELLVVPGGRHGQLETFEPHIGPILGFLSRSLGRVASR